jgi:hypothetical protein
MRGLNCQTAGVTVKIIGDVVVPVSQCDCLQRRRRGPA